MRKGMVALLVAAGILIGGCSNRDISNEKGDKHKGNIAAESQENGIKRIDDSPYEGEDIRFETDRGFSSRTYNGDKNCFLYDADTNKRHHLWLPCVLDVKALDGDRILYNGKSENKNRIMIGDMKTGEAKIIRDGYLGHNIQRMDDDDYISKLFQFKNGFIYMCTIDVKSQKVAFLRINTSTGEEEIFENIETVLFHENGSAEKRFKDYVMDSRGLRAQKGRNLYDHKDDFNSQYNPILKECIFSEFGLITQKGIISWSGKEVDFKSRYGEGQWAFLAGEESIYIGSQNEDGEIKVDFVDKNGDIISSERLKLSKSIEGKLRVSKYGEYVVMSSFTDYYGNPLAVYNLSSKEMRETTHQEVQQIFERRTGTEIPKIAFKDVVWCYPEEIMYKTNGDSESVYEMAISEKFHNRYVFFRATVGDAIGDLMVTDKEQGDLIRINRGKASTPVISGSKLIYTNIENEEDFEPNEEDHKMVMEKIDPGVSLYDLEYLEICNKVFLRRSSISEECFRNDKNNGEFKEALKDFNFMDMHIDVYEPDQSRKLYELTYDGKDNSLIHMEYERDGEKHSVSRYDNDEERRKKNRKFWLVMYDMGGRFSHIVDLTIPIDKDFIQKLSNREKQILRNAYYAKRGMTFKDNKLKEYFSGFYWYVDKGYSEEEAGKKLNAIDLENIKLIDRNGVEEPPKELSSDVKTGEEIEFHMDEYAPISRIRYNADYHIYDHDTKSRRNLKLPWGNKIVAFDGNNILYEGRKFDKTICIMSGDLRTGKVRTVINGVFSDLRRKMFDDNIKGFCQLKDDWLYFYEIDNKSEIPTLLKQNVITGERIQMDEWRIASYKYGYGSNEEVSYSKFIMDERGMVPQRGRLKFDSFDDFSGKWNETLRSFSFGERGVFTLNGYRRWDGKNILFDNQKCVLSKEDETYVVDYHENNTISIEKYDSENNKVLWRETVPSIDMKKFGGLGFHGNKLIIGSWLNVDYECAVIYDEEKDEFNEIPLQEYYQIERAEARAVMPKVEGYTGEAFVGEGTTPSWLRATRDYLSPRFLYFQEGIKYDRFFRMNKDDSNIIVKDDDGTLHKVASNVNYWSYRAGDKIIFSHNKKTPPITLDESPQKIWKPGHIHIGMDYKEAVYTLDHLGVQYDSENLVPRIYNSYTEDERLKKRLKDYSFADILLKSGRYGSENFKLYFDEKSRKLIEIHINDKTTRGIGKGSTVEELIAKYGKEYKMIEKEDGTSITYEYDMGDHFLNFVEQKQGTVHENKKQGTVHEWFASRFGSGYKREEHNEKYWLVMYDQFVDLGVPLDRRFLKMLNSNQIYRLKNAYYAKYGLKFEDRDLKDYYSIHYWYKEKHDSKDEVEKLLNKTDRYNINLLGEEM